MALPESWLKMKIISQIVGATNVDTTTLRTYPQLLDSKEVWWHTSPSKAGMACKTCIHYHLQVELKTDEEVPPKPQHDYDERELIELVKMPTYFGYCSKLLPRWGVILGGIRSDHMCGYFEEKPVTEQFEDDIIAVDDGRVPIAPTIIAEF